MKMRFLIGTASLLLTTTALAQSPSGTTSSPGTQQTQSPSNSSPATQKSPETPLNNQAASPGSSSASPQTTTTAPTTSAGSSTSQPSQAQTNTSSPQTTDSQAQISGGGTANTAVQPSNNANQSPSANSGAQTTSTNNAAPTTSTHNAQSPSTNLNASVNISDQQRTRVSQSISRVDVQPINSVNFSLTVGTPVPRDIRLQTLPSEVVEVVPQYRGYSFFVVRDEIVIVEPSSLKIVTVLPRSGGSTAAASAPTRSKVSFTDKDRDAVRKHVKTRTVERQTTGSSAKTVIRQGERLPETLEVEEFPDVVYREAPSLRDYRYIHRENRTYLVDPRERMVIEEID